VPALTSNYRPKYRRYELPAAATPTIRNRILFPITAKPSPHDYQPVSSGRHLDLELDFILLLPCLDSFELDVF